ncbi:hypothetical protein BDQ12DRAFT_668283 [Crucibulum laeve]|uniref:Uncharacterized protein n=1 Tax=Crucibulum laeve TaxID=68775 RepID=A0A5C3LT00_9AGAR|nr:hypothetical protein BDQ12DRAFT_668283 [Crucibulum laeve]
MTHKEVLRVMVKLHTATYVTNGTGKAVELESVEADSNEALPEDLTSYKEILQQKYIQQFSVFNAIPSVKWPKPGALKHMLPKFGSSHQLAMNLSMLEVKPALP